LPGLLWFILEALAVAVFIGALLAAYALIVGGIAIQAIFQGVRAKLTRRAATT